MVRLGAWYKARLQYAVKHPRKAEALNTHISRRAKYGALLILILLIFSKYFYTSCITSYFTFYLIDKFGVSVQASQICLFVFLAAFAIGTLAGGVFGDRFVKYWIKLIPHVVSATVVTAIGFSLLPIGAVRMSRAAILYGVKLKERPVTWNSPR